MSDCVGRVQRIPHKKGRWVEVRQAANGKYLTIDYEARHQMSHFFLSAATTAQQLDRAMHLSHTRRTVCGHMQYGLCMSNGKHTKSPDKHTPAEIKVHTLL